MKRIIILAALLVSPVAFCQTTEVRDSLNGAVVVGKMSLARDAGARIINISDFQNMVAATGEADAIKFIQTLPGVSTGGEGSSAFYVRGGNAGSNLVSLDGVPIYGASHLLGFTSVYSPDVISSMEFQVGGFTSDEGNLTASHLKLFSGDGDFTKMDARVRASNFILSGNVSMPVIKDKMSFIGALRVSPIGLEFGMIKTISSALDSISRPRAFVYDAFGKLIWKVDKSRSLSLSIFNSVDAYRYGYGSDSDERMQWSNLICNFRYESLLENSWKFLGDASYNRFRNSQGMVKTLGSTVNDVAVRSAIDEVTLHGMFSHNVRSFYFQGGIKGRYARFNPATAQQIGGGLLTSGTRAGNHATDCITGSAHIQLEFEKKNKYDFRASGRGNCCRTNRLDANENEVVFNPEAGLLARLNFCRAFGVEATADWTVQYYHTLEGVPLGWPLDLIVPSDNQFGPEKATQYYAGMFLAFGGHHISVGGYKKSMTGLVYFTDATALFGSTIAGWREKIDIGVGSSRGYEILYEKEGEKLNYRLAYTYSETDRKFRRVNDGEPFPAKFHRPHILNVSGDYVISDNADRSISVTALLTWQSGHRETLASGKYYGMLFDEPEQVQLKYLTGVNNFKMPDSILR